MKGTPGRLQLVLVDSHGRGGRRQVVKAAACGAAIRGFESPRSPFSNLHQRLQQGFSTPANRICAWKPQALTDAINLHRRMILIEACRIEGDGSHLG